MPAASSRSALSLIFLTVVIDLLGFGIVLPLLPRYAESFQATSWMIGLLMASFSAMQFLFAPIWGRLSDRVGRRPVLILGLAGSTISYGLFGYATSLGAGGQLAGLSTLTWLYITRIGAGIAGATIPTAQAYIADVTPPEQRARGMALIGAAFGVGFTFGPLLGALFVPNTLDAPPSAAPGYLASGLSGVALLLSIFRLPESRQPGAGTAAANHFDRRAFGQALTRPKIGLVLFAMFITIFAFGMFETTLSVLAKRMDVSERGNFYMFALIGLILTLAQGLLVRRLVPKLGEFKMAIVGVILMAIGLGLVGIVAGQKSFNLLLSVLPACVVGFAAMNPSLQAMLSLRCSADEQGGMLGIGQSVSALARICGPVAGFKLLDINSATPYLSGACLMLAALVLVLMIGPAKANAPVQVPAGH